MTTLLTPWKAITSKAIAAVSLVCFSVCQSPYAWAQGVAINNSGEEPNPSSILDVSSTTQGVLITRMTTAQRDAISSPAEGLQIYNTTSKCFEFYLANIWQTIACGCTSPPASPAAGTHLATQTEITWKWYGVAGSVGYKYNTVNDYSTATDNGTSTTYVQSGLSCETPAELYVWSYNACGTLAPTVLSQSTTACCNNIWTQLNPSGGPLIPRFAHTAVWDPTNNTMLVYAGMSNNNGGVLFNDLWSYSSSGNAWTQLTPDGAVPSARSEHTAVWDPVNNKMWVFGGASITGSLNDLWSYAPSTNTWELITPGGGPPPVRFAHSAVWDANNNVMWVFGGYDNGGDMNDLWSYTPSTNTWAQLNPGGSLPPVRREHAATWDAANSRMLVSGGAQAGFLGDLWSYSPSANEWTELSPFGQLPAERRYHSLVYDSASNRILLYGGQGANTPYDLWSLSDNIWEQIIPDGVPPSMNALHSAVWDSSKNKMLLFGGFNDAFSTELNDLWEFCP